MVQVASNPFTLKVKAPASGPQYVQLVDTAADAPTWIYASRPLWITWKKPGGDYRDAADAPNGNAHYAKATVTSFNPQTLVFDVTSLVARLRQLNTGMMITRLGSGISPDFASREHPSKIGPALQVVTSNGTFNCPCIADCWVDPSAGGGLGTGATFRPRGMVKFDLSAVSGSLTKATLAISVVNVYAGGPPPFDIAVNYLDMPRIYYDPAQEMGGVRHGLASAVPQDNMLGSHPSVFTYDDLTSVAYIQSRYVVVNLATGGHSFVPWPEYGLTAIRVASATNTPHVVDWHRWCQPKNAAPTPSTEPWKRDYAAGQSLGHDHLFMRYLMMIGTDVKIGMTEGGIKLTGMGGTYKWSTSGAKTLPAPASDGIWEYRTWHGGRSPAHPDLYRFAFYAYDAEHPISQFSGVGDVRFTSVCLQAGRKYSIEQEVKLNTITNGVPDANGIVRHWVDGVLVYERTNVRIRKYPEVQIQSIPWVEVYHGGLGHPSAPFHYELAGICVAREYIGPPKKLA